MRLTTRIWTFLTEDTARTKMLAGSSDSEQEQESIDAFTIFEASRDSIAANTNDNLTFPPNMATAKGLWLRATGSITLTLNGGSAMTLAKPTGASYVRVYLDCDLTSINVLNPSATTAITVDWRVWA